jgi:hypothetical protein
VQTLAGGYEAVRRIAERYLLDRAEDPVQVGRATTSKVAPMFNHRRREVDRVDSLYERR